MAGFESKLCVAQAFAELAETQPIDRITVGMVADRIGKHRKTFYYHFSDKSELVIWLFRYDLAQGITALFDGDELVYEPADAEGSYPQLPFYVRGYRGGGRLYNAPFFDTMSRSLELRRAYYRNVLSCRGAGSLEAYLYRLYQPQIIEDIRFLLGKRLEREGLLDRAGEFDALAGGAGIQFAADFFTGAFIQRIVARLMAEPSQRSLEEVRPFENIVHDSLWLLIDRAVDTWRER